MALITSNSVTGNWSAGSSWVGGIVPGHNANSGQDRAVVVTGAVLTVDATTTIGNNSSTDAYTYALELQGSGSVTIAPSVTLTVKGTVGLSGTGNLYLSKDSTLEFGCTVDAAYITFIANGSLKTVTGVNAPISGHRARVRKLSGSALTTTNYLPRMDSVFTDFQGIGDSVTVFGYFHPSAGGLCQFDHCTFDACGTIYIGFSNSDVTGIYSFKNCTWKNQLTYGGAPINDINWDLKGALNGGIRAFTDNVCGNLKLDDVTDLTARGNQIHGIFNSDAASTPALWTDTFWNTIQANSGQIGGTINRFLMFWDWYRTFVFSAFPVDNQNTSGPCGLKPQKVEGYIVDYPFASNNGDWGDGWIAQGSEGPFEYYVRNALAIPVMVGSSVNGNGAKGSPPLVICNTRGYGNGYTYRAEHVTSRVNYQTPITGGGPGPGSSAALMLNEGSNNVYGSQRQGFYTARSNLVWHTADQSGSGLHHLVNNNRQNNLNVFVDNILPPAQATHNGWYNLQLANGTEFPGGLATNVGTPYRVKTTGTAPGANDVALVAAPAFVDDTRNFIRWYRTRQGLLSNNDSQAPADVAAAIVLMKAVNDDGADTYWTPTNLYDWVAAGWITTTTELVGHAHDGSNIGFGVLTDLTGPTGVVVTQATETTYPFPFAMVAWTPTQNVHKVYTKQAGGNRFLQATVPAGVAFSRIEGLFSATKYFIDVTEIIGTVETLPSTPISLTTPALVPTQSNVTVVSTVITPTTILINFSSSSANIVVYRSADGGGTFQLHALINFKSYLYEDGLIPDKNYTYRFANVDYDYSAATSVTYRTLARPTPLPATPVLEPMSLTVVPTVVGGVSSIVLTWVNMLSPTDVANRVIIERADYNGAADGPVGWTAIASPVAGVSTYTDQSFTSRRGVYYRIRATDETYFSDYVTPTQKMVSTPSPYRGGITVQVGPGKANAVLTDALIDALGPGDTLEFYWDGVTPLLQKVLLSSCGTAGHPITFKGIDHANGTRPAFNGNGAVAVGGAATLPGDVGGQFDNVIYFMFGVTPKGTDAKGYKPDHWIISGLEIYNCRPEHSYIQSIGGSSFYDTVNAFAACIYVKNALNVDVDDCYLHDGPNCIRQGSGKSEFNYSSRMRVTNCTLDQWGHTQDGIDQRHGLYLDGHNIEVKNNVFLSGWINGAVKTGGIAAKIRGGNTLIQGNTFADTNGTYGKCLDVIDAASAWSPHYLRDPNFHRSEVVGNRFFINASSNLFRIGLWGHDVEYYATVRGPHYVHDNTFVSTSSAHSTLYLRIGFTYGDDRTVGLVEWGNVWASNSTSAELARYFGIEGDGTIQHGKSFASYPFTDSGRGGHTVGLSNVFSPSPNPVFVDLAGGNYRPDTGSPLIDAWTSGPPGVASIAFDPLGAVRTQTGSGRDLGAYEFVGTVSLTLGISGSASIAPGVVTTYTFTPSGSVSTTVTLDDGRTAGAGVFNPPTLTWTASAAAQTATYTAAGPNNVTLTGTGAGITVTGKAVTVAWTVSKNVIFLGDALTYGTGATLGVSDYPKVALSRLDGSWTGTNFGVVGQSASMVAASPSQLAIDAAARVHATRDNIVIAQWGTDDLRIGTTNTTLMNFYATIAAAYRAAALAMNPGGRFRFIAQTIQPGYDVASGLTATYDVASQQSWNAYLRANYAANGISCVSDIASNPLIGQAGAETNATYFDPDKVHMTAAGYALVAAVAATALAECLYSGGGTGGVRSNPGMTGGY